MSFICTYVCAVSVTFLTPIFEECLFEEEQHLSEITFLSPVQFRTDTPHIDIQQNVVVAARYVRSRSCSEL